MTRDELLAAYARGERDFARAYLRGANLSMARLFAADLREADLSEANLSGAYLSVADLREADLSEANLFGARLSVADLFGADLSGARLSEADLSVADLRGANLSMARLFAADLREADLSEANLSEAAWGATRLHDSGTWSAAPPRCAAGDWHAWALAPGIVRIGCTTLTVAQWLADGPRLAADHGVSPHDAHTLRQWLLRLDTQTEWPGWVEDGERGGE